MTDDSHEIWYLTFSKIGKDVEIFVVCCSLCWRFKGLKGNNNQFQLGLGQGRYWKQIHQEILHLEIDFNRACNMMSTKSLPLAFHLFYLLHDPK